MLTKLNFNLNYSNLVDRLTQLLTENRKQIAALCEQDSPTWQTLIQPLEHIENKLHQFWAPVSHLNSVKNSLEGREAYNACLPLLSEYSNEMNFNQKLYQAYLAIQESAEYQEYSTAKKAVIAQAIRDFKLSGVNLPKAEQAKLTAINLQLSELTTKFEEHIIDSVKTWQLDVEDKQELAGLPEVRLLAAQQKAKESGKSGYQLSLDFPCYCDVVTFADNRKLRETFYRAHNAKASSQDPAFTSFDNTPVINELLALRQQKAKILGFTHYAELSLARKMADSPQQVERFLDELVQKVKPHAELNIQKLQEFSKLPDFQPWDVAYYSEKFRQQHYALNQELISQYFPVDTVISGLFAIVEKLFAVTFEQAELSAEQRWHDNVRFYHLLDNDGQLIGGIYFDLYAREGKRGGAWMDEAVCRYQQASGNIQLPVAFLTCNFAAPTADKPALLRHDDVVTLFHECGHCLQHLLTTVNELDVSGISGVAWDAVEFPSQFLEAWCWQAESLALMSAHYQTGEALPVDLIDKMIAAKNYNIGLSLIRQLEFALFDLTLYEQTQVIDVGQWLTDVRKRVAVIQPPADNRFQNSFSHIFAGGYAAGYYSYLWAEVLARDAFTLFKQQGIFNQTLGLTFRSTVLGLGGSVEPAQVFEAFAGRQPQSSALLDYYGLEME